MRKQFAGLPIHIYDMPLMVNPALGQSLLSSVVARAHIVEKNQLEPPRKPEIVGAVGVVQVIGGLTHRYDFCTSLMGGTSYQQTRWSIEKLVGEGIRRVLLDVDSPGGMGYGVWDLADWIYGLRDEGITVWALARDLMCSAAYALSSAAERLLVTQSADAGNIGVYMVHWDDSKYYKKVGFKPEEIYAGKYKVAFSSLKPLSKDARRILQNDVDATMTMFVESVAKHRGLTVEDLIATDALWFRGQEAVERGLADGVSTYEQALKELSEVGGADVAAGDAPIEIKSTERSTQVKSKNHKALEALVASTEPGTTVLEVVEEDGQHGKAVMVSDGKHYLRSFNLKGEAQALGDAIEVVSVTQWLPPGQVANEAALQGKVAALETEKADIAKQLTTLQQEKAALSGKVATLETDKGTLEEALKSRTQSYVDLAVDLGVHRGTITPATRGAHVQMGLENPDKLAEVALRKEPVIPTRTYKNSADAAVDLEAYQKMGPAERRTLYKEDPELHKELSDALIKQNRARMGG